MKYVIQFITICVAVVIVSACAPLSPEPKSSPDSAQVIAPGHDADGEIETDDVQIPVALEPEAEGPLAEGPLAPPELAPTPGTETDLWQRIRDGFVLDHRLDQPRVKAEFDWYRRHPDYLDRVATRASRHLYHIVEAIEERGLPMEFALLPIVESAFDPFAYSHGRASGLWQFIPGTGRRYGLKIDYWYDGRRDVPEATRAALDYLEALYTYLGDDWLLALAAYNSGEGNVSRSVRKNTRAGKDTDFWSLSLLAETRAYVPRLLAISALIADPGKYNIELKSIANEPYWKDVDIGSQLDLARASELAGISMEELYLLNPAFNKWSTHPEGPHRLLVPVGKAEAFQSALAALPAEERLSWTRHAIKPGENLGSIASRYNTSVETLRTANNIRGNMIRAGDSLLIPVASRASDEYGLSETERLKSTQASATEKLGTPVRYVVKPGDSLWHLSRRFGVSTRKLAKWNAMAPTDLLMPGTELAIFTGAEVQVTSIPAENQVIRKVNYRVRNGESLSVIANKFNLPMSSVRKWNKEVASRKYLQPGDRITLYVDVTNTGGQ